MPVTRAVPTIDHGVMRLVGLPLPTVHISMLAALVWFLGYFVAGQCERVGWSGYALILTWLRVHSGPSGARLAAAVFVSTITLSVPVYSLLIAAR